MVYGLGFPKSEAAMLMLIVDQMQNPNGKIADVSLVQTNEKLIEDQVTLT